MSRFDAMYPKCGPECTQCSLLCKRADYIDSVYASKLAFMMECLLVDHHGHWNAAAALLDEYKSEWDRINPRPPTFMGEPMPPERRERLENALANHAETSGSPCTGVNPPDVRADVRALQSPCTACGQPVPEDWSCPVCQKPDVDWEAVAADQAMTIALLKAQAEPMAWRTFDGEGGYDYRTYDGNENYRAEYIARNGEKYARWVEPLYLATPQPAVFSQDAVDAARYRWMRQYGFGIYCDVFNDDTATNDGIEANAKRLDAAIDAAMFASEDFLFEGRHIAAAIRARQLT